MSTPHHSGDHHGDHPAPETDHTHHPDHAGHEHHPHADTHGQAMPHDHPHSALEARGFIFALNRSGLPNHLQHRFADAGGGGGVLAGDEVAVDNHVLGHRDLGGGVLVGLLAQFVFEAERDLVGAVG